MADSGCDLRGEEQILAKIREKQLREAFARVDAGGSGDVSLEEVVSYFRSISDEVELDYVKMMFDQLDTNRNHRVSIDEFLSGYIAQVNELSGTISELKAALQSKQDERGRLQSELTASRQSEKKNAWGIMDGSKLYIRVLEAQKLSYKSAKPSACVEVQCERQRVLTRSIKETRSPSWSETFEFCVQVGTGEVLFSVLHDAAEFLGLASVSLSSLRDQKTAVRWLSLLDTKGQETQGKLQVAMQWIHSQTLLLAEEVEEIDRGIANIQADIARMEAELQRLGSSPLGLFQRDSAYSKFEREVLTRIGRFADAQFAVSSK